MQKIDNSVKYNPIDETAISPSEPLKTSSLATGEPLRGSEIIEPKRKYVGRANRSPFEHNGKKSVKTSEELTAPHAEITIFFNEVFAEGIKVK